MEEANCRYPRYFLSTDPYLTIFFFPFTTPHTTHAAAIEYLFIVTAQIINDITMDTSELLHFSEQLHLLDQLSIYNIKQRNTPCLSFTWCLRLIGKELETIKLPLCSEDIELKCSKTWLPRSFLQIKSDQDLGDLQLIPSLVDLRKCLAEVSQSSNPSSVIVEVKNVSHFLDL